MSTSFNNTVTSGAAVVAPEVAEKLIQAAGGREVDAADVPDTRWEQVPAFGLVSSADQARLPTNAVDAFPMTRQQVSMVSQMLLAAAHRQRGAEPVPAYHNVAMSHLTVPAIDADAMCQAGRDMVAAHEMLRSTLDLDTYSCPMQIVHANAEHELVQVVDLRGLTDAQQQQQLERFAWVQNGYAINLRRAPLVTFTIHLLSDTRLTLTITEPHAIADGWSTHLNLVEFFERYAAALAESGEGRAGAPRPVSESFGSALRQHSAQQLWQLCTTGDVSWWREYLLVGEASGTAGEDTQGSPHTWQERLDLGCDVVERLDQVAASAGVGLKVVLLAAHLRALSDLSATATPTTGVIVNTRLGVEGGADSRGMFLNVVPLRSASKQPGSDLLRTVHRDLMEVTIRGRVPLSHLARTFGRHVVPESLFVYNRFHSIKGAAGRLGINTFEQVDDWSHTDFAFEASFNRSEEHAGHMFVLLFAQTAAHAQDRAVAAYTEAVDELASLAGRP